MHLSLCCTCERPKSSLTAFFSGVFKRASSLKCSTASATTRSRLQATMISAKYSHCFSILLALAVGLEWVLAENTYACIPRLCKYETSNNTDMDPRTTSTSSFDQYVYTLTYTQSGTLQTSTCMDWAADTEDFHTLPACPGTDPDAFVTASAPPFTARNYTTDATTSEVVSTSSASASTTTAAPSVSTTSATVTSADISGVIYSQPGSGTGSASATSTSTSSATFLGDQISPRFVCLILFSSVCALFA